MLKRLQKYRTEKNIGIVAFQQNTFDVFKDKYKINNNKSVVLYEGKIIMKIGFLDSDMESVM